MSEPNVPINRINKFFKPNDYDLEIKMGKEWLHGDMNFTLVLYRIDRYSTKVDDVYGEALSGAINFLPPVEFKAQVRVEAPDNKYVANRTAIDQLEPGNITISIYQADLEELEIEINYGDYIGYYETENKVRYYVVNNDGRVVSDNRHTYGGYKPFYRTIKASPVSRNEFNGL